MFIAAAAVAALMIALFAARPARAFGELFRKVERVALAFRVVAGILLYFFLPCFFGGGRFWRCPRCWRLFPAGHRFGVSFFHAALVIESPRKRAFRLADNGRGSSRGALEGGEFFFLLRRKNYFLGWRFGWRRPEFSRHVTE